jgi:serine/threonine protein phosphatase PrpC
MAAALAEVGQISEDEIADHPRQNILTRALGRKNSIVEAELMELPFLPGDTLLLCSDGLWKAFKGKKAKLEEMLQGMKNMHHTCRQLLMEANELDGSDNISLIIVSARSPRPSLQQRFTSQAERQVREAVAV